MRRCLRGAVCGAPLQDLAHLSALLDDEPTLNPNLWASTSPTMGSPLGAGTLTAQVAAAGPAGVAGVGGVGAVAPLPVGAVPVLVPKQEPMAAGLQGPLVQPPPRPV